MDEIPWFFLLLKNHFTCEDIGVAMVTNINFDFLEEKT